MIEGSSLTPMVRQYLTLKEQHQDCLLFFRLGDFYELFYEDAQKASTALDIVLTKRGKDEDAIPMCGIPFHSAETYIGRLIRQGFKVAICEQLETPEDAKKRGYKAIVKRDVVRIITPGTLVEENLLSSDQNNFLLSVHHHKNTIGLSAIDISTGEFWVQEIPISQLESALSRFTPTEILVSESTLRVKDLYDCFQLYKNKITRQPDTRFDFENGERRLCSFLNTETLSSFGDFSITEIASAGGALEYIYLTQKECLPRLTPPKKVYAHHFLQIDATTRRSLELEATTTGERKGSFFSVIDHTATPMGRRHLFHCLSFPLVSVDAINKRLDHTSWFLKEDSSHQSIRKLLKEIPDGERLLARLSSNRGGPRDLLGIQLLLNAVQRLDEVLKNTACPFSLPSSAVLSVLPLKNKLERALNESAPFLAREGGFIRAGYLPELDEIKRFSEESQKTMAALQAKYATDTNISSLKIKYNNILGYYIEVTSLHKDKIPSAFIHRQTLANNMRFSTPELMEIQEKVMGAAEKALNFEQALFNELVQDVLDQDGAISQIISSISYMDLISSFATLASVEGYCRPTLTEDRVFRIKRGRHPTVESMLKGRNSPFIPNDCQMDLSQNLLLLTGPNMAGKSTYLRQNALIIILAQMGSYVPAEEAHIGIVDRLFSRVGAGDDLTKGRSTFMMEMIETASIVNQATSKSFVILDEIGRGTSTYDGLSIAQATAEYLHNINQCRTLFATHYHEMTVLEEKLEHLKCYTVSVKEWEGRVVFMHTILPGKANQSYGIHVAALAGMPQDIVKRADAILKGLESKKLSEGELPLTVRTPVSTISPTIISALESIDPNTLSPREALEKLYQLKEQLNAPVMA